MTYVTRFAPSPTGPLHLGHAFSALTAFDRARAKDGHCLIRIEDIDTQRSKPEWEVQIYEDLAWLGMDWPHPVLRQSDRVPAYREVLGKLWRDGLLFACTCNRKDILAAASAPQEGAPMGPDGVIYPGTCRNRTAAALGPDVPEDQALRLNMSAALERMQTFTEFSFVETGYISGEGPQTISFAAADVTSTLGDIILSRRDFPGSYHLSVVLDDAAQNITEVVRGEDLFDATQIHVVLAHVLGLPIPTYHHHRLIRDNTGTRLAKRDDARSIATYRADGATPEDIRRMVGLPPAAT